jgi:hypothetical protein
LESFDHAQDRRRAAVERLERIELIKLGELKIMPDLRTWLNEVDKLGQLMTVDNVHLVIRAEKS